MQDVFDMLHAEGVASRERRLEEAAPQITVGSYVLVERRHGQGVDVIAAILDVRRRKTVRGTVTYSQRPLLAHTLLRRDRADDAALAQVPVPLKLLLQVHADLGVGPQRGDDQVEAGFALQLAAPHA